LAGADGADALEAVVWRLNRQPFCFLTVARRRKSQLKIAFLARLQSFDTAVDLTPKLRDAACVIVLPPDGDVPQSGPIADNKRQKSSLMTS
jgi:hypothetical protein